MATEDEREQRVAALDHALGEYDKSGYPRREVIVEQQRRIALDAERAALDQALERRRLQLEEDAWKPPKPPPFKDVVRDSLKSGAIFLGACVALTALWRIYRMLTGEG